MRMLFALCAALAPLLAVALDCPAGYEDIGLDDNRCYMYSSDVKAWTPAYTTCLSNADQEGKDGNLVTLEDNCSYFAQYYKVRSIGEDHWTGLLNVAGQRSWADNSVFNPELEEFIAADAGDDIFGYMSGEDGKLRFDDGTAAKRYICYMDMSEGPSPTTTPAPTEPCDTDAGFEPDPYNGICYLFSTEKEYWPSAGHACHELGAELVSIPDSDPLIYLVITASGKEADVFWTGLEAQNGVYVWEDGTDTSTIDQILPYLDEWSVGEDCVALQASAFPTPLQHTNCITQQNFICYKPANTDDAYVPEGDVESWL